MLLISKMLSQLVLPPGGLILLIAFGALFFKRIWGKATLCLALLLFWGLSTEPVRDMLIKPLEFQYPTFHAHHLDKKRTVIVLLGGGVYENAPEYAGQDYLHSFAIMRTLYAAQLAKQTGLDVYATGGKPLNPDQDAEGDVMKKFLLQQGLHSQHVFSEYLANNTWQNAVLIQMMLKHKGISTVVLVTSAWHMPRSVACFKAQGLNVISAPTDYLTKMSPYDIRSYLPSAHAFYDSNRALHEYLGLFFYRLRYAM
ncbi:MAG: YdcF family protein [Mariprofundaceae bacterium]|nr:YdcF family protein [Mariprofundaceae bacterium]